MRRNCIMFFTNEILRGSEFYKVNAAIEKALVPMLVSTLGTKSKLEIDD